MAKSLNKLDKIWQSFFAPENTILVVRCTTKVEKLCTDTHKKGGGSTANFLIQTKLRI